MPEASLSDEPRDGDAVEHAPAQAPPQEDDPFSDANLTKVIKDYMPLVRHAVNRVAVGSTNGGILQYEDMVSYGVQGLIEAFYAFDPNKGAKFSTYALPRIRGSILDAIRATHPLPRSLQKFGSDLEKATAELHVKLDRAPTRDEIAQHMGIPTQDFLSSMRTSNVRVVSLDSLADTAANGNSEKLWEMADDDPNIDPDAVAEETMVRAKLAKAVDLLPDRERTIVRLYYMKSQSLKSIGLALGISESRASQLRHRAIRRLRVVLTQELADAA
ncbi:MAG TPA: FliA/WhiG family RNA polymerase sigma factor [Dehalococcoidia bacterium]|nr:FliA/WhiG family RNA polymerase sigma factor [Dehalococcoidia bacterium]